MGPKSFYLLRFAVKPGGARKDAHFVRATLDEIKRDLDAELLSGKNLYLLCWYGAKLTLDVYQRGELAESIDLHRYVRIKIEGHPAITFDESARVVGHDFKSGADANVEAGSLSARMLADEVDAKVTVAWEDVVVPQLAGEIVDEASLVTLEGDWREGEEVDEEDLVDDGWLRYGLTDLEE